MGEAAKTEKAPKKSFFKGMKSEFKKIVWPDKKSLVKQTTAVVIISVLLTVLISIVDAIFTYGIDFLVK